MFEENVVIIFRLTQLELLNFMMLTVNRIAVILALDPKKTPKCIKLMWILLNAYIKRYEN